MHAGAYDKMMRFSLEFLHSLRDTNLSILEIGSQNVNGSYRPIFENPNWDYTGVDMVPGPGVDFVLQTPYDWAEELETNSYDVVISGSVLEHIEFPWITMIEIARVMKPGGLTCHIAPSAGFEHRFPVDCYRYYPDGFKALAKWADLELLQVYTDWFTSSSIDGGHVWHDSVLVARKKDTVDSCLRAGHMETLVKTMNKVI